MRHQLSTLLAMAAFGGLVACGPDSPTRPSSDPDVAADGASGAGPALVVDDDRADCPRADFTSIQAAVLAAEPGAAILVCAGTYRESVTVPSAKSGLRLQATGAPGAVTLDGSGALPIGFLLEDAARVRVEGFTVTAYSVADIQLLGGGGHTIRGNATTGSLAGIALRGSSGNIVEHNRSFGNLVPGTCGIFAAVVGACGILVTDGAADNVLRHNEVFGNMFGVQVSRAGAGNVVHRNDVHDNDQQGIHNVATDGTLIEENRSYGNLAGVRVAGLPATATAAAIVVSGVTVRNNYFGGNRNNGVVLFMTRASLVEGNHNEGNIGNGIQLNDADDNVVRVNRNYRNDRDGIRAFPTATGNLILQNIMEANVEHDAHDDSVGPGTAGTANVWEKNHCATENRPGLCEHGTDGSSGT